jgi:HTH-type transcriptional regulator/antitoxin PezA
MAYFSGDRLRQMRERRRLSLRALADELDTTAMAISRYENGRREPGLQMIELLSKFFRVHIEYFIESEELRMNDIYQLSLEKEAAVEYSNYVVNRLMNHMIKTGVPFDAIHDPLVVLYDELSNVSETLIPGYSSIGEVKDAEAYLRHVTRYIERLETRPDKDMVA